MSVVAPQQVEMFGSDLKWQDHYDGMPECINEKQPEPEVVARFKFRSQEDFEDFMSVVKDRLYNGGRVFDGNQKIGDYQAWYPLPPRPSDFVAVSV